MPEWKITIKGIASLQDRYTNDEIAFDQMRDEVVKISRHKLAPYLREPQCSQDLVEILDELAEVDTATDYDYVKSSFYDWCDSHRVWVDPIE